MADAARLRAEGVISEATLAWFQPQWQAEQERARELEEESRYFLDFGAGACAADAAGAGAEGEPQAEDAPAEGSFYRVALYGRAVEYCRDRSSSAHANDVWAASISAAFRAREALRAAHRELGVDPAEVRILELGAGTAIPSLLAAHELGDVVGSSGGAGIGQEQQTVGSRDVVPDGRRGTSTRKQVYISDVAAYHNIRQLVLSASRHPRRDLIKVAPHTWGEACGGDDCGSSFLATECDGQKFHLLIVSDCIYNPEHQEALLDSICHALAREGRAIVAFSLHGNTAPENVWAFFDRAAARGLHAPEDARRTEDMEETMKQLGLHRQNMGSRFVVHVHELRWR